MATRRPKSTVLESAARGAAAGLVGGAVLVTAHRVLLPRLPDRKRRRTERWDKGVGAADDFIRAGMVFTASLIAPELEPRQRRPRGLRRKAQHKALRLVSAPSMFSRATTLALRALAG
jgi:hypothetical protein